MVGLSSEETAAQQTAQIDALLHLQHAALEAAANAIIITDGDAIIRWANPAFSALTGYSLDEARGQRPRDLLRSGRQTEDFYRVLWQTIKRGEVWRGELINRRKDGTLYTESQTVTPVRDPGGRLTHFIAVTEDITERKRLEQRQLAQSRLLEKTTGDLPLTKLLDELIRFIEEQAPELRCSILLADENQQVLRHGAAPSLPEAYNRLVDRLPIQEGCGTCGTAGARRERVISSDIGSDPLWAAYLPSLTDMPWLRACWSTPFFDSQGRLLGTFGVYPAECGEPNSEQSELIAYAVAVAQLLVERKRANEALRQSEGMLATVLDSVDACIYIKDTDRRYRYANRRVCELVGKSPAEIVGLDDTVFFDAATVERLHASDRRVFENGVRIEAEELTTGKTSGIARTYLSIKLPLKNEQGEIYALCGISTDITDRQRLEGALRDSNERLGIAIRAGNIGLWDCDLRTHKVFYSSEWKHQIGYADDEIGDELAEWESRIHPEDLPGIRRTVEDYLARPYPGYRTEFRFRHKNGSYRWILAQAALLYDADGRPVRMLGSHVDITDRKQAEQALRASEERLQLFIEHAPVALAMFDRDMRYVAASRRWLTDYGIEDQGELRGRFHYEIFPEIPERWKTVHRRAMAGEVVRSDEEAFTRRDGTVQWLRWEVLPWYAGEGGIGGIVIFTEDITDRKQAEARSCNLNRVYTVLSNINQAIVRLRDVDQLFTAACRIAVEDGGFRMAWIGVPDRAQGVLRPVARFGAGRARGDLHLTLEGGDHGPCGTAFRENRTVYCNDIAHDPTLEPWRAGVLQLGLRAAIAVPIRIGDQVRGIFNLYTSQAGYFTDEEIRLLEELANDLAFALEAAEAEAERHRAEERLRQAAAVFECTREGVMVTDASCRIVMINRAFTEITGYTETEVLGQTPALLKSGRHDEEFYSALWANIEATGHWQGDIWNRRKNGETYPELLSISVVKDALGAVTGYVGVFADISKLKSTEAELEFLAHHDPLTRLPNRLLLLSRLEHGIELARREHGQLALLMVDLDRFKDINDSFGHPAGDELLQQVAKQLTARLRRTDTVTRLGGDEFTVLLEHIAHPEDAARVADEIIGTLNEPRRLANRAEVQLGASIGISLFPQHGQTATDLLQHADAALYQAKAEGRGRFKYFSEDLTRAARERIDLEARLRRAILRDELRIYYQPQVDIATSRVIGAEALLRWEDPERGLVPPGAFIPAAEATGLIGTVGEWVLQQTCLQGRRWLEAGLPPLSLAVNVSPQQFARGNLAAVIETVLAETGFPSHRLELELTESALMERQQEAVNTLEQLRAIGVRVAIDDFGIGYSSLAYLKRFSLDVLKIDKSFVDDLPDSQDDREIATTIIAIARTLRLKVLAEGVETAAQLSFLKAQGCDSYQGYLKSPPLPAAAFQRLLQEQG